MERIGVGLGRRRGEGGRGSEVYFVSDDIDEARFGFLTWLLGLVWRGFLKIKMKICSWDSEVESGMNN